MQDAFHIYTDGSFTGHSNYNKKKNRMLHTNACPLYTSKAHDDLISEDHDATLYI